MGQLGDFAKRNSAFISFDEEGIIEGVYEGAKIVIKDSFGKEKEVCRYRIDGKTFDSISGSLATQMDKVPVGSKVRIKKTGEAMDTKYVVEILGAQTPVKAETWDN